MMSGQLKGIMDNRNKKDVNIDEIDVLPEPEQDPETLPEQDPIVEDEEEQEIPGFDDEGQEDKEPAPEIDYKEKFSESSREASALYFKNQKLTETIDEASSMPEPTVDELKAYAKEQGADYDELDTFSQNILKKTLKNERYVEKIKSVTEESKKIDTWSKKVDEFIEASIDDGKYPTLNSLSAEFKKFAMKEARRGTDLDDLVASFLFNAEKYVVKSKKSLLLSGGNGSAVPPKPKGLTDEQVARIRERDPKEYRRLIKAGKINIEI